MDPLTQLISKQLTEEDELKLAAKLLGFKSMPVGITQFIEDPYYLGDICKNLYPFWKEKAKLLYPTPIHNRHPILVFKGAIGTGKSTFVRVLAMYQIHKLMCLKNIHNTFGLMPGKNIKFSFFSYTSGLAQTDFLDVISDWIEESPYFAELNSLGRLNQIERVADGTRGNKNIGSDVLFYNLSELNFVNYDKAWQKLDQALKRFDSRFGRMTDYFGHIIIDTSSQGDDSIADQFVESNPYGDKVYTIDTNQWVVREHLHYYGRSGWFKVYCGDSIHQPFIVDLDHPITMDMDLDRVINVPEELRADFEFDLITALQDKAGKSVSSTDKFLPDTTKFTKCFTLPMKSKDVIRVDFYDRNDKLIYYLDAYIKDIPDDKIIYIHYDIGVTGDNTGLGLAYFNEWHYFDKADGSKFRMPKITVPIGIGMNRYQDQETPIYQLEEFIYDLNQRFEIGMFSADQFASRQLFQDLKLNKINNRYISVDRTDEPYVLVKSLGNLGLLELPMNNTMKVEYCELRRVGGKIDHPSTGCFIGETRVIVRNKVTGKVKTEFIINLLDNYKKYQILSYNFDKNLFEYRGIRKVWKTKTVTKLTTVSFIGFEYKCTPEHQWLTDVGYVEAHRLYSYTMKSCLSTLSPTKIRTSCCEPTDVFDIEVIGNHNFCLSNGVVVHNSKDIADAVTGAIFSCYQDADHASQLSSKYKVQTYSKCVEDRATTEVDKIQGMLNSLY